MLCVPLRRGLGPVPDIGSANENQPTDVGRLHGIVHLDCSIIVYLPGPTGISFTACARCEDHYVGRLRSEEGGQVGDWSGFEVKNCRFCPERFEVGNAGSISD